MRSLFALTLFSILFSGLFAGTASGRLNLVELTQKQAENQVRHLIEPLLDRYCRDQCKLLSVNVTVDIAVPEEVAPGFDDVVVQSDKDLAPTNARLKLLIDDKVGPISRGKLVELLQQYLDTLDYPVKIDTQVAHFPQPVGSEGKVGELRERIARQFQATINDLIQQFCPEQCLLADFSLQTEVVNPEESQYGSPGEFVQEAGVALRIKDISGTLLMDETMAPEERANVLEMAKLKTNSFRHVSLTSKSMKFPHPTRSDTVIGAGGTLLDRRVAGINGLPESQSSKETKDTKGITTETRKADSVSNSNRQDTNSSSSKNDSTSAHSSRSDQKSTVDNKEENNRQERFERFEKIERVENGDAVQAELQKFKVYGLVFACSILSLLIFIAAASFRSRREAASPSSVHRIVQSLSSDPLSSQAPTPEAPSAPPQEDRNNRVSRRYEIDRLIEELSAIFAEHPKVAKNVFSRVLTEEGVETTSQYIHIFGEGVVVDMLRDPSLQSDLSELMEYYAKTPQEMDDEEKLDLLRRLHNRTIAGKLVVLGNRSSNLFDFLAEMDPVQILELIRKESLTVKAIVLTQCDQQKRGAIYMHLDEDSRMKLLAELSRIDYLPRDYIFNVSNALKRKRRDNPKLNTEALPGSEVLVTLLERTGTEMQRTVVKNLEASNPDSARTVKSKLVSIDTLRYLRDGQLLEVVLSLKHDELLHFLKGAPDETRAAVFAKSPRELVVELEEELANVHTISRETYLAVERKVLNRMKLMSNDGLINLVEVNERMFQDRGTDPGYVGGPPPSQADAANSPGSAKIKKVAGW